MTSNVHTCVDCAAEVAVDARLHRRKPRKIANPGDGAPRCLTHLRRFKTRQRQQARGRSVERTYDISAADNGALLTFQDGRCWICRKATGASKLLATDHDHSDDWVRGRLCSTCNQYVGRQLDDDPEKARRLVQYLSGDTPYRRMLAQRLLDTRHPGRIVELLELGPDGSVTIWWRASTGGGGVIVTLDELAKYATPKS